MDEEYLPRGGYQPVKQPKPGAKVKKGTKTIFKDDGSKKQKAGVKRKANEISGRKSKKKKSSFKLPVSAIGMFDQKLLVAGMQILGCVKEVQDYELLVSLPNGVQGSVQITQISEAYTQLLQSLASSDGQDSMEELQSLHELFHVGEPLRCQVLDVIQGPKKQTRAKLTIDPRLVNKAYSVSQLRNGMVFSGVVSSIEDHGYVVDIGVKGAKAFLRAKQAATYVQDYRNGDTLHIGSYLTCMVTMGDAMSTATGENRTVKVNPDPKKVYRTPVTDAMQITLDTILPGLTFDVTVTKLEAEGVVVKFLNYTGTIHTSHLNVKVKDLHPGEKLRASVLYINPTTKAVTLTSLVHLVTPDLAPRIPFPDLEIGVIVQEAKVIKVDSKKGVFLKLNDQVKALANKWNLSDKPVEDVKSIFHKGELHKCRVTNLDYNDRIAHVSLKQSVINMKVMRFSDLTPAMLVQGTVRKIQDRGISVALSPQLKAFVPKMHLADVALKNPQKRFSVGDKIKCKILTIDAEKKKITATCKKSLLSSKLPSVTCYDDLDLGMTLEGFIVKVMNVGVIVAFYNNFKGFVPKHQLSIQKIEHAEQVFFLGQVVKCQVVNFDQEANRLTLTFKLSDRTPFGLKSVPLPNDYVIGNTTACKIKKKTETGFEVELLPSNLRAFLPKMHLSDHVGQCDVMHATYQPGQQLEKVMYIGSQEVITVTMKQSLIAAAEAGELLKTFEDLKPGQLLHGVVRKFMEYGAFVDLLNGLIGLVPNKFLCDRRVAIPSLLYREGQSVQVKVTEVDQERKRCLLSQRLADCYHGDTDVGVKLVRDAVRQAREIQAAAQTQQGVIKDLAHLTSGQIVKVTITEVNDNGALCTLENGVRGFVTYAHYGGVVPEQNAAVEAVVLHSDLMEQCVELSMDKALIKRVRHLVDNKFSQAQPGQVVKSEVVLVKDDFVLVALKNHTMGRFAYLPSRRHLNDVLEQYQYSVGQVNATVIKLVEDGVIYGSLQIHEQAGKDSQLTMVPVRNVSQHKIGDIIDAHITKVFPWQLNVALGKMKGRIHVTESQDQLLEGINPLEDYTANTHLQARIISFRHSKGKAQSISSKFAKTSDIPELSIRPSVMEAKKIEAGEREFKVGQKVNFFVKRFQKNYLLGMVSTTVEARIHRMDLSTDMKVLKSPSQYFQEAHGYTATVLQRSSCGHLDLTILGPDMVKEDALVSGVVVSTDNMNGAVLRLANNYYGKVHLTDISDTYRQDWQSEVEVGDLVRGRVISITSADRCHVTLRKSRLKKKAVQVDDPEIMCLADLHEGQLLRGFVTGASNKGVFVRLSSSLIGRVQLSHLVKGYVQHPEECVPPGRLVTVKVLSIKAESQHIGLSMLEEDTGLNQGIDHKQNHTIKRKPDTVEKEDVGSKKRKMLEVKKEEGEAVKRSKSLSAEASVTPDVPDSGVDTDSDTEVKVASSSMKKAIPRLTLTSAFSLDMTFTGPAMTFKQKSSDDSDSDDDETTTKKTQKPKNRSEKKQALAAEEKAIRLREEQLLDKDQMPESTEDFERMVLESPDSSLVWLRYMAFHLETAEVEKARAVAERALKTISFREEQEKLNMWVAYLNLENMYGTPARLQDVFDRAVQHNEPLSIYQQLVNIYAASGKSQAAETLYQQMSRKFSLNKEVWVKFGRFYFQDGKADLARKLMQRSFKSLNKKDHLEILSKFAQMEFKEGEPERGKTMFENMLNTYPKRTDLWLIYIDQLIKIGDITAVRQVFERVINSKLSAKKMKTFFKKYLEFEEKYGDDSTVEEVKQKAVNYVEAKVQVS